MKSWVYVEMVRGKTASACMIPQIVLGVVRLFGLEVARSGNSLGTVCLSNVVSSGRILRSLHEFLL
jgi:hypothetical protein